MTKPALKVVSKNSMIAATLACLIGEMETLRDKIDEAVGPNAGTRLSLGDDGQSFEALITLNPFDDGKIAAHVLERQPLDGHHFTKVMTRPVRNTINRREIVASIIAPTETAL